MIHQITDGGRIAGTAFTATGDQHAIAWTVDDNGNLLDLADLGILNGYETSGTSAVNDLGETIGNAYRDQRKGKNTIGRESAPFFINDSGMADLNGLVVDFGGLRNLELALDVNQLGWICGQAVSRRDIHGFVAIPVP